MNELVSCPRDERGAATAEYAALSAAVASGVTIIFALRWAVEHHDVVLRVITLVIQAIMALVGRR